MYWKCLTLAHFLQAACSTATSGWWANRCVLALLAHSWWLVQETHEEGKLVALTVYYKMPGPAKIGYYAAEYRVHWLAANPHWGKWEYDDDDDYAGNMADQIDMIELTIAKL